MEGPASPAQPLTPAQQHLDANLRAWRKSEAAKTGKPAFIVLSDRTLTAIAAATPQTLSDLNRISGIGPDKSDKYGADIIALCRGSETAASSRAAQPSSLPDLAYDPRPLSRKERRETSPSAPSHEAPSFRPSAAMARPPATAGSLPRTPQPQPNLTPAQQALDTRLRTWRTAEADRLGLPQFFVLGATSLRSLVLSRPSTLAELRSIEGIGLEKSEKFGPALLELLHP